MRKRSISIKGHRTSVLLEPEFWCALEDAAARRGVTLPKLIGEIDRKRTKQTPTPGLASALRVFALLETQSGVRDEA
ncbi:MAG: ribbon-helix-helix domain-containing protein [Parvularculaceae bacterium]